MPSLYRHKILHFGILLSVSNSGIIISSCTGIAAYLRTKQYITFVNKKTKNTFLIDTAVPNTHNFAKTITDKQNQYQELANEVCAMWKQKAAQVIPTVIPSTGVIP